MSHNLEYLLSRPGGLKITTIIIGIVAAVLNCYSYADSSYTSYYEDVVKKQNSTSVPGTELELSNMTLTFIILGVSIVYLAAHALFYAVCESRFNKFIDVTFHLCGALFLFAGGTTVIYSAIHIQQMGCKGFQLDSTGRSSKHHFLPLPSFLSYQVHNIFSPSSPEATISSTHITKTDTDTECHHFAGKIVGGSLNLLNGAIYGFLAVIIHGTQLDDY